MRGEAARGEGARGLPRSPPAKGEEGREQKDRGELERGEPRGEALGDPLGEALGEARGEGEPMKECVVERLRRSTLSTLVGDTLGEGRARPGGRFIPAPNAPCPPPAVPGTNPGPGPGGRATTPPRLGSTPYRKRSRTTSDAPWSTAKWRALVKTPGVASGGSLPASLRWSYRSSSVWDLRSRMSTSWDTQRLPVSHDDLSRMLP